MTRITALSLSGLALLTVSGVMLLLPDGRTAYAATEDVSMGNNFYSPTTLTISIGDTVQWTWPAAPNAIPHSVTSDTGIELDSATQATGTYSHRFAASGTYDYHCVVHGSGMSGTITVQQAAAPTPTNTVAATNTAAATSTATRTGTATAVATGTPALTGTPISTAVITPTHTSGLAPTQMPAPRTLVTGGAAAGGQLPSAGTGSDHDSDRVEWLSGLFGLAGLLALTAAGVVRKRG